MSRFRDLGVHEPIFARSFLVFDLAEKRQINEGF